MEKPLTRTFEDDRIPNVSKSGGNLEAERSRSGKKQLEQCVSWMTCDVHVWHCVNVRHIYRLCGV